MIEGKGGFKASIDVYEAMLGKQIEEIQIELLTFKKELEEFRKQLTDRMTRLAEFEKRYDPDATLSHLVGAAEHSINSIEKDVARLHNLYVEAKAARRVHLESKRRSGK